MKKSLKILMGVLVFALALSCFGLMAAAEGEADYSAILEYFEQPVYYDLNFEYASVEAAQEALAATVSGDSNILVTDAASGVVTFDPKNGNIEFGADLSEETAIRINFRAKAQTKNKRVAAELQFRFSYDGNPVTALRISQDARTATATFADNTWYNVEAVFIPVMIEQDGGSVPGYQLLLSVADDDGNFVELGDAASQQVVGRITSFRVLGMQNTSGALIYFDSITAYSGSFSRLVSDFESEVDPMLVNLYEAFLAAEDEDEKFEILEIANRVVSPEIHAYVPVSSEAQNAAAAMQNALIPFYARLLVDNVALIGESEIYADRVALCDVIAVYDAVVPADYSGSDAAEVLSAKSAFAAEKTLLRTLETQSLNFIAAMEGVDVENGNFAHLKQYYERASRYTPYASYEGVAEVLPIYAALESKYLSQFAMSEQFKAQAAIAADESRTIGERYIAYDAAKASYFTDTSCAGIETALEQFASVTEYLEEIAAVTREFIDEVAKAESSTYYSAKVMYLDRAEEKMETAEPTFPGVAEAKALYNSLRETIAQQKEAVDAYIAAVDAIDADHMNFMQLKAAVDHALELQKTGDITGFDGVSEANIKLSDLERLVKTPEGYSKTLIAAVAALDAAESLSERRAYILLAVSVRDAVESSYEGVPAALTALDAAILAYNAEVAGLNAAYEEVASAAFETVAASVPRTIELQIIAILKKVFGK